MLNLVIPDETLRKAFKSIGLKAAHWHYQRAVKNFETDEHFDAESDLREILRLNPDHHYAPGLLSKVEDVVQESKKKKRLEHGAESSDEEGTDEMREELEKAKADNVPGLQSTRKTYRSPAGNIASERQSTSG